MPPVEVVTMAEQVGERTELLTHVRARRRREPQHGGTVGRRSAAVDVHPYRPVAPRAVRGHLSIGTKGGRNTHGVESTPRVELAPIEDEPVTGRP